MKLPERLVLVDIKINPHGRNKSCARLKDTPPVQVAAESQVAIFFLNLWARCGTDKLIDAITTMANHKRIGLRFLIEIIFNKDKI